ncbi:MAG TPA: tripartite tricarboxylate transporter substrate binding protein [Pseudolabrys sp.]|jgi:tripartite-type tricarboxylate transporter receptor subunit TctC|nr:tripartite tricarboxylate transporter substrate binding protein [Pseudolabrys sp.]
MIRLVGVFLIAVLAFVPQRPSSADETYPTRPIRLIVGFAAGSSGDVAARIVSHKLGDLLGQTVIVENRPGASSMIATDYVARSAKDGYTLLFATIAATINTTLMPGKGANFEKDMAPIVLVGSIPNILVVNPDLAVNNVKELIALAKQKPDELLYGASGLGSGPHLATELFKQMAGIKMTGVLYPGSGQTVMDLISGRIQVMFSPASTVLAFIKDGRVRALATTESKRTNAAPELPTISESALPGYDAGLWFGILGPAGLPKPIIDKISNATNNALKDPDVLKQLTTQGLDARGGSPEEFALFIKTETDRWARVIRQMDAAKESKDGAARP